MGALADSLPSQLLESDSLALADGAAVSSWSNAGSSGGAYIQGTAASQPTYQTAETPTGLAALQFDGVNDAVAKASGTINGTLRQTLMAVVKVTGGAGASRTILGTGGSTGVLLSVNAAGRADLIRGGAGALYAGGASVLPAGFALISATLRMTHDATASSTNGTSWPENAFDGSTATGWAATAAPSVGTPQWLRVRLDSAAVVSSVNITNASVNTAPKDFTIQGSNDGSSWTTLDTRAGVTWASSAQTQTFAFSNSTAYTYYRVSITACTTVVAPQIREVDIGVPFTPAHEVRVDGVTDGTGSLATIPGNNAETRVGSQVNETTAPFNGLIAFVARWDRALSASELAAVEAEVTAKYLGTSVPERTGSASVTVSAGSSAVGVHPRTSGGGVTVSAGSSAALVGVPAERTSAAQVTVSAGSSASLVAAAVEERTSGATVTVSAGSRAFLVPTGGGQLLEGGFAFGSTLTTATVALQQMAGGFAFGSRLTQSRTWSDDPRSTRPAPRVVITQRDGTPVLPLANVAIGELTFRAVGTLDSWRFSIDRDDPAARIIDPVTHEAHLYRGSVLMSKGPIGPARMENGRLIYDVADPRWYLHDKRRVIGRVPKLDWCFNGDFSLGLSGWRGGYDGGSAPEAPPKMAVVDEAESSSGKALRIEGVDKVVTNVANVETAAVFVANEATYLSGGAAKVIAAAADIPDGATIHVVGHTADRRAYGDSGTGLALSLARAQAAKATLAAHNSTWTFTLLPGLRSPNLNDGVSAGRGYYEQVAPNSNETDSAKNRRVALHYTATETATGHRQFVWQERYVSNPVASKVPLEVTVAGRMAIGEWIGSPLDGWALRLMLMQGSNIVKDAKGNLIESTASMSELTPRERWHDYSATIEIPPDGVTYRLVWRMYPPAGWSLWADVGVFPHEQLGFFGVDQAHIIRDLVRHVQDPAMGKGDLGIKVRATPTGIKRTMEFPFHDRWPWSSAVERITSLARGVEVDCEQTPTTATIVTHYLRQGSTAGLALTHGGSRSIVKAYRPIPSSTRSLASSVIVQGWGFGATRAERYARDAAAFGGALLEGVIEAEEGTPPGELDEVATLELSRSIHPLAAWELVLDPARTSEILDDIGKGDTTLVSLPDEGIHSLHRLVAWSWDPETDALTVQAAPEEA